MVTIQSVNTAVKKLKKKQVAMALLLFLMESFPS